MSLVSMGGLTCLHIRSWIAVLDKLQTMHRPGMVRMHRLCMVSGCSLKWFNCTGCKARQDTIWQVQSLPPSTELGVSKACLDQPAMPNRHRLQSRPSSGDMTPSGRDHLNILDGLSILRCCCVICLHAWSKVGHDQKSFLALMEAVCYWLASIVSCRCFWDTEYGLFCCWQAEWSLHVVY